jgi:hypothetical protein
MRSGLWKDFVGENRHLNITLVSGDAMPNQLEFLSRDTLRVSSDNCRTDGIHGHETLYDLEKAD